MAQISVQEFFANDLYMALQSSDYNSTKAQFFSQYDNRPSNKFTCTA